MAALLGAAPVTVTCAVPDFVLSALDLAVMVKVWGGLKISQYAVVYIPDGQMYPVAQPPPIIPLVSHVTDVSRVPATFAVNFTMSRWYTEALAGVIETEIGIRLAVAVADLVASAAAVATTLTAMLAGTGVGAVYMPEEVIVPQVEPEHPDEVNDHVTAVFELPRTTAVNCWVAPATRLVLEGEIVTETDCGGGGEDLLPPQLVIARVLLMIRAKAQ